MAQCPVEVLANIIKYCDATSFLQVRLLCRASNRMCKSRNFLIVAFRDACRRNFSKAKGSKTKASHWLCCWPAEFQAVAASEFRGCDLVHWPCCYQNNAVIPPSLAIASSLTHLCIRNACLETIPNEFFALVMLKNLDLSNNNISGFISNRFTQLVNLKSLSLSGNCLNGNFDGLCFPDFPKLEHVKLDRNNLSGHLTGSLGRFQYRLMSLNLSRNKFTGPIPDIFRANSNTSSFLTTNCPDTLDFGFNELTGAIPDTIGVSMRRLEKLLLNNNRLSGNIPPALGNREILKVLYVIHLDSNVLEGAVPAILASLPKLTRLNLAHNLLSGKLPNEFGQSNSLKFVAVNGNQHFNFAAGVGKSFEIQNKCPPHCPDCR